MSNYVNGSIDGVVLIKKNGQYVVPYQEFLCITKADIADLPLENIPVGSVAFCIETKASLMFDGTKWVEV